MGKMDQDFASEEELTARYEAALQRLPWRSPIYLPTEKMPLRERAEGLERVATIHNDTLVKSHRPALKALREKYSGHKRAFILGNGPSLNRTDLDCLENEVTFCVNSFFLKVPELRWSPTFYVVEDHLVAEDRAEAINEFAGPIKLFPAYLGYCLDENEDTIFFNHRARISYPHGFDFSPDASKITYTGCTVTFTCMQLAHYLGFQELYLLGVDASYAIPKDLEVTESSNGIAVYDMSSDDPNHFHPDYFGKGMRWHDPQVDKMIEAYEEARRVTDALGRPIYNATVGGMLEVFERRDFTKLFPHSIAPKKLEKAREIEDASEREAAFEKLESARDRAATSTAKTSFPRVLLLDFTPFGQMAATGELKQTLFADWPRERLMQVHTVGHDFAIAGGGLSPGAAQLSLKDTDRIRKVVAEYDPDLILYRPVPDKPEFTALSDSIIDAHGDIPLALWVMDDWLTLLEARDREQYEIAEPRFRALVERADTCIAISEAMGDAFEARYGKPFSAVSNGVDPQDWTLDEAAPSGARDSDKPFIIRYAGGLSDEMSLQSALDLAEAVERLNKTRPVVLEMNTRDHWLGKFGDRFDGFQHTTISCDHMTTDAYRDWLMSADMTAILYNFDETSIRYVRYSLANKTVECLAAGAPVLAYGPRDIHTIDFLAGNKLGLVVEEQSVDGLVAVLGEAISSPDGLQAQAKANRNFAFRKLQLTQMRKLLYSKLRKSAAQRTAPYGERGHKERHALEQTFIERERRRLKLELEPEKPKQGRRAEVDRQSANEITPTAAELIRNEDFGSEQFVSHTIRTDDLFPVEGEKSRPVRILEFYASWRGVVALLALTSCQIGSGLLASTQFAQLPAILISLSMSFSLAVVFFFLAYMFTVVDDHHRETWRMSAIQKRHFDALRRDFNTLRNKRR